MLADDLCGDAKNARPKQIIAIKLEETGWYPSGLVEIVADKRRYPMLIDALMLLEEDESDSDKGVNDIELGRLFVSLSALSPFLHPIFKLSLWVLPVSFQYFNPQTLLLLPPTPSFKYVALVGQQAVRFRLKQEREATQHLILAFSF